MASEDGEVGCAYVLAGGRDERDDVERRCGERASCRAGGMLGEVVSLVCVRPAGRFGHLHVVHRVVEDERVRVKRHGQLAPSIRAAEERRGQSRCAKAQAGAPRCERGAVSVRPLLWSNGDVFDQQRCRVRSAMMPCSITGPSLEGLDKGVDVGRRLQAEQLVNGQRAAVDQHEHRRLAEREHLP
jgi:hypothetical protein